ncbi:MAG: hypothetical protein HYV27_24215 [Candidatus Hydrogenedentes bacterium]|nr:hypothetical protein [Candidatus Hydrogenedentota bacterium]
MRSKAQGSAATAREPERRKEGFKGAQHAIKIEWSGFKPMYDYWGNEIRRYYQLETLASATEHLIRTKDYFIQSSLREVLGPGPITSMRFTLFQEGRFQLIFQLRAANARKKTATFAFVVAKNSEECSKVAYEEHQHLKTIHPRNPKEIVEPYRGGNIFLPDRHKRIAHGREVYAYLTSWLNGFDELGVDKNLQFIINIEKYHTFTLAQTETIKQQIIMCMLRTYDPVQRSCMAIPEIASGDFVVQLHRTGRTQVRLIACRKMMTKVTLSAILRRIITAQWDWGKEVFFLRPEAPETLAEALIETLGQEDVAMALPHIFGHVKRREVDQVAWDYVQALREIVSPRETA